MYRNNGKTPLYVVKRKEVELYHCGSFSSATPKLYMKGHAKTVCNTLNKRLDWDNRKDEPVQSFDEWRSFNSFRERLEEPVAQELYSEYVDSATGGPWVVCELQLAASEAIL